MGQGLDGLLVFFGAWLLFYGILWQKPRYTFWMERINSAICGGSIVILSPLAYESDYTMPLMLVLGMLVGSCCLCTPALLLNISGGSVLAAMLWKSGLDVPISQQMDAEWGHFTLLTSTSIIFLACFWATKIGPMLFIRFTVPMIAAMLFTSGLAGLVPEAGGQDLDTLLPAVSVSPGSVPLVNVCAWLGVSVVGIIWQFFMIRMRKAAEASDDKNQIVGGSMVEGLLPGAADEGSLLPRPMDASDAGKRHRLLAYAMYSKEGDDLSYLTDHERKLVECCRDDEFQRDRVLWGGGLM